jgi:hypothetical protein
VSRSGRFTAELFQKAAPTAIERSGKDDLEASSRSPENRIAIDMER